MMQSSDNGWRPCRPGTLSGLAEAERQVIRDAHRVPSRRTMLAAGGVAALLLVVAALLFWPRHPQGHEPPIATLNCRQAVALFDDYRAHRLSAAQTKALEQHLKDCPGCAKRLAEQSRRASHD